MTGVTAASTEVHDAVVELEARRQRALVDGNLAALDAIFDEALVHIHAPGIVHTKEMLLEHVASRRAYLAIERGDLSIREVGELAIAVGSIHNTLRNPDGSSREQYGTVTQMVRRCDDGAWRFLHFQLTPSGDEVWGKLASENEGTR